MQTNIYKKRLQVDEILYFFHYQINSTLKCIYLLSTFACYNFVLIYETSNIKG
jgi:hypothetical protein